MEFVNGKDDIPYMKWKRTNVWNHQPVYVLYKSETNIFASNRKKTQHDIQHVYLVVVIWHAFLKSPRMCPSAIDLPTQKPFEIAVCLSPVQSLHLRLTMDHASPWLGNQKYWMWYTLAYAVLAGLARGESHIWKVPSLPAGNKYLKIRILSYRRVLSP